MNTPAFKDRQYSFRLNGKQYSFVVRKPENTSSRPALLLAITTDWKTSLNHTTYNTIPNIFLSAGYNVASFDLPNHGELINRYGEGLVGWANAISDGVNVIETIRKIGSRIIDIAIKENLAWQQTVALMGVSRGGFSAMHIMAHDSRVYAAAVCAPVTDLRVLKEFNRLKENKIVLSANAENLVPALADRFLCISIGEKDPRIDEKACYRFHAMLSAASKKFQPELFVLQGETHGTSALTEASYIAGASFLLGKIALRIKERVNKD